MTFHRYRLRHDYSFLRRGEVIQLSVGGDFYPTTLWKWAKDEFRIPAAIEKNRCDRQPERGQTPAAWGDEKEAGKHRRQIEEDERVGIKKHGAA